ncbi:MAG: SDR family oxidoreductase [Caldilineaceae bacterium]
MEIAGKTALITGGAHRVGKAITMMLATAGANVAVNYHSSADAAYQTVAEAKALGVQALPFQCDVADRSAVAQMTAAISAAFGGVDIIVNAASFFGKTPFPSAAEESYATWTQVTRVLIDGPFFVCNMLVPTMQARGGGVIVNIVDLAAWQPLTGFMAHVVGKAGLLAMTRQLALELAPEIRANAVAPGLVLPPPNMSAQRQAAMTERNLLNRWGAATDVAQAVKYLIEADFVTGEVLTVDGGERYGHNKPKRK